MDVEIDEMVHAGLIEEAKLLHSHRHLNALQTVGYKELFQYLDGDISLEEAISLIKQNTRRYAKRQLTWFRKDSHWKSFSPTHEEEIIKWIMSELL